VSPLDAQGRNRKLEAIPIASFSESFDGALLKPAEFEFSMCFVAVIIIDGSVAQDGDLAAFVNGELRGVVSPSSYVAPIGPYKGYHLYNMMAFGQKETESVVVTFQYRRPDGNIIELATNMPFTKDALVGSVDDPFIISSTRAWWHARS